MIRIIHSSHSYGSLCAYIILYYNAIGVNSTVCYHYNTSLDLNVYSNLQVVHIFIKNIKSSFQLQILMDYNPQILLIKTCSRRTDNSKRMNIPESTNSLMLRHNCNEIIKYIYIYSSILCFDSQINV